MGTLYISSDYLRFVSFREGQTAFLPTEAAIDGVTNGPSAHVLGSANLEIRTADIIAVQQTFKSAATLTTETGIAIELENAKVRQAPTTLAAGA